MAILDSEPALSIPERLIALEAKTFVQGELIRALIGRTAPHQLLDTPFLNAVRSVNKHIQGLPPEHQAAYTSALKALDPLNTPRFKPGTPGS